MPQKNEYERVSIDIPKQIMDLLRFAEPVIEESPKEWIENAVLREVKAGLESTEFLPTSEELLEKFSLQAIIKDP